MFSFQNCELCVTLRKVILWICVIIDLNYFKMFIKLSVCIILHLENFPTFFETVRLVAIYTSPAPRHTHYKVIKRYFRNTVQMTACVFCLKRLTVCITFRFDIAFHYCLWREIVVALLKDCRWYFLQEYNITSLETTAIFHRALEMKKAGKVWHVGPCYESWEYLEKCAIWWILPRTEVNDLH